MSSDAVAAASIRVVVPVGVHNGIAADVAAFDAGDLIRRLCGGRHVCGIRRLGCVRVRLSLGTAAARAERHLKNAVFHTCDHAVRLEAGRRSLRAPSVAIFPYSP